MNHQGTGCRRPLPGSGVRDAVEGKRVARSTAVRLRLAEESEVQQGIPPTLRDVLVMVALQRLINVRPNLGYHTTLAMGSGLLAVARELGLSSLVDVRELGFDVQQRANWLCVVPQNESFVQRQAVLVYGHSTAARRYDELLTLIQGMAPHELEQAESGACVSDLNERLRGSGYMVRARDIR